MVQTSTDPDKQAPSVAVIKNNAKIYKNNFSSIKTCTYTFSLQNRMRCFKLLKLPVFNKTMTAALSHYNCVKKENYSKGSNFNTSDLVFSLPITN